MAVRFHFVVCVLAVLGCVVSAGCNKGPYTAKVTGLVTLDDKPISRGDAIFHPKSGGPMAYGKIGSDGRYSLRTAGSQGLIPGNYTATVVAFTKDPWEGITAEQVEKIRITPRRYALPNTSDQQFTIAAGTNQCDLRLKSK